MEYLEGVGIKLTRNDRRYEGNPDILIEELEIAIFVDSCFWHGCPDHYRKPSSNVEYWQAKFDRNTARDKKVNAIYEECGWTIIRIWEHDLKNKAVFGKTMRRVLKRIQRIQLEKAIG
jgi:DNA mismatch endonuclease (patch repair protein)